MMNEREWFTDELESESAEILADTSTYTDEGRRVFEIDQGDSSYLIEEEKFELEDSGEPTQYTSLKAYEIPEQRGMEKGLSREVGGESPIELKAAQVYKGDRLKLARDLKDEIDIDVSEDFEYGTAISLINSYGEKSGAVGSKGSGEASASPFHEPNLD